MKGSHILLIFYFIFVDERLIIGGIKNERGGAGRHVNWGSSWGKRNST